MWVQSSGMIDLGYQGADFTWSNGKVKERLDRSFCWSDWRILFADAKLMHLAKMKSAHCPLLIRLKPISTHNRVNPPFRFHAMWMQHSNYMDFVTSVWNKSEGNMLYKTKVLASSLNAWNKEVFGSIFHQ